MDMHTIKLVSEPGDPTKGLRTLCDVIDGLKVRRWAVSLLTADGLGVWDSLANAEAEESDEQEKLRDFLDRLPREWIVRGALVTVDEADGKIAAYALGDIADVPDTAD